MAWMSEEKRAYIANHQSTGAPALQAEPEHFYQSTLLKRGWTLPLIASLLGDPDQLGKNYYRRSGPPTKLYLRSRVEAIEAQEVFQSAQLARASRRSGAAKAVETKRSAIMAEIAKIEIKLPLLANNILIIQACENRNAAIPDWKWEKEDVDLADPSKIAPWPEVDMFRDRICVNFLRHGATKYDTILRGISGRVAKRDAHRMLSRKIFDAIGSAYPQLKAEAERQYRTKWECG